jgi:hypothetical protein
MRHIVTSITLSLLFLACKAPSPEADVVFKSLKNGQAQIVTRIDGDDFYPEDSRFKGEVTVAKNSIRLNLFDQYESNVILSLTDESLFAKKPVQRTIEVTNQNAGSMMIGRVRDKKLRTGDGFLMADGTVTVESLSEEKVVIKLSGMTGNFNTLNDKKTWKKLEALIVYKRPTISMRSEAEKSLLY